MLNFLVVFVFSVLSCFPDISSKTYTITDLELTQIQTSLMTAQQQLTKSKEELTLLQTQLQIQSELLTKSKTEIKKKIIKYSLIGFIAGINTGVLISICH